MATGGREGDIPWGEELNLRNLINAPAIVKVVDWKDASLELGVEKHELEKIDRECHSRINDCMRDMFSYLLDNALELTWEEVNCAVRTVTERQTRQEKQKTMEEEERNARQVLDQLPKSLHQFNITNGEIERVDDSSDIPTVKEVIDELGIFERWYPLGIHLKLVDPVLKAIDTDGKNTEIRCVYIWLGSGLTASRIHRGVSSAKHYRT